MVHNKQVTQAHTCAGHMVHYKHVMQLPPEQVTWLTPDQVMGSHTLSTMEHPYQCRAVLSLHTCGLRSEEEAGADNDLNCTLRSSPAKLTDIVPL